MRVKKQRRHRKSVRFYTACYGFRQPFKIICDGTFVYHMLVHKITPADTALSNILGGGPVKLFTTKCLLAELKKLGNSHSDTLQAAQKLMIASCGHETAKSADNCIREIIGEKNQQHFFVATQDNDLRKRFQEIPGVPVIFGLRNALFLEQPSATQKQYIKNSEEDRAHMKTSEYNILKKRTKEIVGNEDTIFAENDRLQSLKKKGMEAKDRVQFKRKRAKGPNPLSCKKKKNPKSSDTLLKKENKINEGNKVNEKTSSNKPKRKRSRKKKTLPQGES